MMTIETHIPKYICDNCDWQGNNPKIEFEIDMPETCPNCGKIVLLNWNNPNIQLRFFDLYFKVQQNIFSSNIKVLQQDFDVKCNQRRNGK